MIRQSAYGDTCQRAPDGFAVFKDDVAFGNRLKRNLVAERDVGHRLHFRTSSVGGHHGNNVSHGDF